MKRPMYHPELMLNGRPLEEIIREGYSTEGEETERHIKVIMDALAEAEKKFDKEKPYDI